MSSASTTHKALILGWEFPPIIAGGLSTACYGLTKALAEHVQITLILPRAEASMQLENTDIVGLNRLGLDDNAAFEPDYELVEELHYITTDLSPYPVGIAFTHHNPLQDPVAIRAMYSGAEPYGANIMEKVATYTDAAFKIAQNKEFDIIHAHDWITFPAAMRISEATGKPLVVHIHSLETDRIGPDARFGQNDVYEIEQKTMIAADHIFPVSGYTRQCAVEYYGIDPAKCTPIYNAPEETEPFKLEKAKDEKYVLFLGRVTYQKGPEFMVETAVKLAQKQENVRFLVVGVGDKLEELKALANARGVGEKFIFAGFLKKAMVQKALAMADVYFMPSVSEPFGLSALEAAQFDIPCVVSAQSGVSEVMPHALKADFWDTDRFANYIYALLNYPALSQDIVVNNKEDMEELSWERSAAQVVEVYNQLINKND